jgi:hypothetical protein
LFETAVEKVGSEATKAKVTLDKADVFVMSGKGSLGHSFARYSLTIA